jgi:hypothetical protein
MLQEEVPRNFYIASSYVCPIYTQYSLIYTNQIANKEEAGLPLVKKNIHKVY